MSIPNRIYLQYYGDQEPHGEKIDDADVTWSRESVFHHDVEYVRESKLRVLRRALEIAAVNDVGDPEIETVAEQMDVWIEQAIKDLERGFTS